MNLGSKRKWILFILISCAILFSYFPNPLHAQTFNYSKAITIDHTKVSAALTNFPVLISIANDNDLKNHVTSSSGYDLIFKDAGGTKLDHELESWNGTTGTLIAWVRIPSLSSTTDTIIYMWYGNSNVTTSQENKPSVWNSNYKAVWHLKEATGSSAADSTSNANTGTPQSSPSQSAGNIDGSLGFNGTTQYVSTSLTTVYQQFTLSAWIKSSSSGHFKPTLIDKISYYALSITDFPVSFYAASDGTSATIQITPGTSYTTYFRVTSPTFTANQWHHVVATYDGTTLRAYADGAYNQGTVSYTLPSNSRTWSIGRSSTEAGGGVGATYYTGYLDEVRISNIARPAEWILTEYNNQSSPLTFYTVGNEVDVTPPSVTVFVIPSTSNSTILPLTTFTATDNVAVTGYLVNESASTPALNDPNWSATPQTQYVFSSDGNKTLYAWAKDGAGNISSSLSATTTISNNGNAISYVYDALNRLIQVIYADGRIVTYTYDATGNRTAVTTQ